MSIIKLNDRAVKDATTFGSISSLGEMKFISKATASASASIEFTSGIDSTYKEYVFYFNNIHPATDGALWQVNFRDGGAAYDAVKTSTSFRTYQDEGGTDTTLGYYAAGDLAQSTGVQRISGAGIGADNDQSVSGILHLFNPSSTTFVKHFMIDSNASANSNYVTRTLVAGYCNTTTAIDGVRFQMSSGNIDAGEILLFGIN